jgi:hypothetical protein
MLFKDDDRRNPTVETDARFKGLQNNGNKNKKYEGEDHV